MHDRPNRLHVSRMTLHFVRYVLILPRCKWPGEISNPRPGLKPGAALRGRSLVVLIRTTNLIGCSYFVNVLCVLWNCRVRNDDHQEQCNMKYFLLEQFVYCSVFHPVLYQ